MHSAKRETSLRGLEVIQEATAALVRMDVEWLEEFARSGHELSREDCMGGGEQDLRMAGEDLRLMRLVLDETRANLAVLNRLYAIRLWESGRSGSIRRGGGVSHASDSLEPGWVGYGNN